MKKKKKENKRKKKREKKTYGEMRKGIKSRNKPQRRRGSLRFIGKHINSNSESGKTGRRKEMTLSIASI
jgi:ribosomal protein L44E